MVHGGIEKGTSAQDGSKHGLSQEMSRDNPTYALNTKPDWAHLLRCCSGVGAPFKRTDAYATPTAAPATHLKPSVKTARSHTGSTAPSTPSPKPWKGETEGNKYRYRLQAHRRASRVKHVRERRLYLNLLCDYNPPSIYPLQNGAKTRSCLPGFRHSPRSTSMGKGEKYTYEVHNSFSTRKDSNDDLGRPHD